MIDLHGAPGSQNGYDNSGHRGAEQWHTDPNNVLRTKLVIQSLSQKYSDPAYWQVVTMLALLNEPATYLSNDLLSVTRQYWYDAYGAARYPWAPQGSASKSGLALVIHDGFQALSSYQNYMSEPNFEDVFIDTHNYQVFNNDFQTWDWNTHIKVGHLMQNQTLSSTIHLCAPHWLAQPSSAERDALMTPCNHWPPFGIKR